MYIYTYINVYIYIYIYIQDTDWTLWHVYVYMYLYTYIYMYRRRDTDWIPWHVYVYIRVYMYICVYRWRDTDWTRWLSSTRAPTKSCGTPNNTLATTFHGRASTCRFAHLLLLPFRCAHAAHCNTLLHHTVRHCDTRVSFCLHSSVRIQHNATLYTALQHTARRSSPSAAATHFASLVTFCCHSGMNL